MDTINEQLNSKYGWSSCRKIAQGAPARGLDRSGMNNDVLGWVPGTDVAIRMESGAYWLYQSMTWPGMGTRWMPCKYVGNNQPTFNAMNELLNWVSDKKFNGLNITDK